MALSLSCTSSTFPCSNPHDNQMLQQPGCSAVRIRNPSSVLVRCEADQSDMPARNRSSRLEIGSPVIVIEAPKMIKTAASVPCLRANSGLVKPGDVGRIVSRKPKDVWAVRLAIGTYLLDGKYFKALEFDE